MPQGGGDLPEHTRGEGRQPVILGHGPHPQHILRQEVQHRGSRRCEIDVGLVHDEQRIPFPACPEQTAISPFPEGSRWGCWGNRPRPERAGSAPPPRQGPPGERRNRSPLRPARSPRRLLGARQAAAYSPKAGSATRTVFPLSGKAKAAREMAWASPFTARTRSGGNPVYPGKSVAQLTRDGSGYRPTAAFSTASNTSPQGGKGFVETLKSRISPGSTPSALSRPYSGPPCGGNE